MGDGIETDPFAGRLAMQGDGEIGVDEQVAIPIEDRTDVVAGIRRGEGAFQRVAARPCRMTSAEPDRRAPA
jgi:hypothetical protein